MAQGSSTASFTGILVKRDRIDSKHLVQLLFRNEDKNVLCVSADPKDNAWQVGQTYVVEGTWAEKLGHKFVRNPHIHRVKKHWSLIKKAAVTMAALAVLAGGGSAATIYALYNATPTPAPAAAYTTDAGTPSATYGRY